MSDNDLDFEGIDWDAALDEWEHKNFAPDVRNPTAPPKLEQQLPSIAESDDEEDEEATGQVRREEVTGQVHRPEMPTLSGETDEMPARSFEDVPTAIRINTLMAAVRESSESSAGEATRRAPGTEHHTPSGGLNRMFGKEKEMRERMPSYLGNAFVDRGGLANPFDDGTADPAPSDTQIRAGSSIPQEVQEATASEISLIIDEQLAGPPSDDYSEDSLVVEDSLEMLPPELEELVQSARFLQDEIGNLEKGALRSEALLQLSQIHLLTGAHEEARTTAAQAVVQAKTPFAHWVLRSLSAPETWASLLTKSAPLASGAVLHFERMALGRFLYDAGDRHGAAREWEHAWQEFPEDPRPAILLSSVSWLANEVPKKPLRDRLVGPISMAVESRSRRLDEAKAMDGTEPSIDNARRHLAKRDFPAVSASMEALATLKGCERPLNWLSDIYGGRWITNPPSARGAVARIYEKHETESLLQFSPKATDEWDSECSRAERLAVMLLAGASAKGVTDEDGLLGELHRSPDELSGPTPAFDLARGLGKVNSLASLAEVRELARHNDEIYRALTLLQGGPSEVTEEVEAVSMPSLLLGVVEESRGETAEALRRYELLNEDAATPTLTRVISELRGQPDGPPALVLGTSEDAIELGAESVLSDASGLEEWMAAAGSSPLVPVVGEWAERRLHATTAATATREPSLWSRLLHETPSWSLRGAATGADRSLDVMLDTWIAEPELAWMSQVLARLSERGQDLLRTRLSLETTARGEHDAASSWSHGIVSTGAFEQAVSDRAELASGKATNLAERLLTQMKSSISDAQRLELFERLARIDALTSADAANLWNRTIAEEFPGHLPSLLSLERTAFESSDDDGVRAIVATLIQTLAASSGTSPESLAHLALYYGLGGTLPEALSEQVATSVLRVVDAKARFGSKPGEDLLAIELLLRRTRTARVPLLVRGGEAAIRAGDLTKAGEWLREATELDPQHLVAWYRLSEVARALGQSGERGKALEAFAEAMQIPEHRSRAWSIAADHFATTGEEARRVHALEQIGKSGGPTDAVFDQLRRAYESAGKKSELVALLEERAAATDSPEEKETLLLARAQTLHTMGDPSAAREATQAILALSPDHREALELFALQSEALSDWPAAEETWVRLLRLEPSPEKQKDVYIRLGGLYLDRTNNLARAEQAFQEVLKRAPDDDTARERLIKVYLQTKEYEKARAIQEIRVQTAQTRDTRRVRLVELATIYEEGMSDTRRAEQVHEQLRREFPTSTEVLRGIVEFFQRHRQGPAVQMVLDRTGADLKRAFLSGQFNEELFTLGKTIHSLRGDLAAAEVIDGSLAAFRGMPNHVRGVGARATDPQLEEYLAPDALPQSLRVLLQRAAGPLEALTADLSKRASLLPRTEPSIKMIEELARAFGIPRVELMVAKEVPRTCIALSAMKPTIVLGETFVPVASSPGGMFLLARAMKAIAAKTVTFHLIPQKDVMNAILSWLHVLSGSWTPPHVPPQVLQDFGKRMRSSPYFKEAATADTSLLALEVAGAIGAPGGALGLTAACYANRAALLLVGDATAALEALAWNQRLASAPSKSEERAAWIRQNFEAKDLLAFSASDAYLAARKRAGA